MPAIVLVAIDLARLAILLAIDLGFFLRSQLATVCLTVGMHFLIDLRLMVFEVCRFAGGQLAALECPGRCGPAGSPGACRLHFLGWHSVPPNCACPDRSAWITGSAAASASFCRLQSVCRCPVCACRALPG